MSLIPGKVPHLPQNATWIALSGYGLIKRGFLGVYIYPVESGSWSPRKLGSADEFIWETKGKCLQNSNCCIWQPFVISNVLRKNLVAEAGSLLRLLSKPQVIWKITGLEWLDMLSHWGKRFWRTQWPGSAEFCCKHREAGCSNQGVGLKKHNNRRNLSVFNSQKPQEEVHFLKLAQGLSGAVGKRKKKKILHEVKEVKSENSGNSELREQEGSSMWHAESKVSLPGLRSLIPLPGRIYRNVLPNRALWRISANRRAHVGNMFWVVFLHYVIAVDLCEDQEVCPSQYVQLKGFMLTCIVKLVMVPISEPWC